jgi:hypothetical protein
VLSLFLSKNQRDLARDNINIYVVKTVDNNNDFLLLDALAVSFFFVTGAILQPSLSVNSQPTEELHLHEQYYFYDPGISS